MSEYNHIPLKHSHNIDVAPEGTIAALRERLAATEAALVASEAELGRKRKRIVVPAEVLNAAMRMVTPINNDRLSHDLQSSSATGREDARCLTIILEFLRSLDIVDPTFVTDPTTGERRLNIVE